MITDTIPVQEKGMRSVMLSCGHFRKITSSMQPVAVNAACPDCHRTPEWVLESDGTVYRPEEKQDELH